MKNSHAPSGAISIDTWELPRSKWFNSHRYGKTLVFFNSHINMEILRYPSSTNFHRHIGIFYVLTVSICIGKFLVARMLDSHTNMEISYT
jgi:hypothetical protein